MDFKPKIIYYPDRPGIRKFFGELEGAVMEIVWENHPISVKRALYLLKKDFAYTTIMTVMNRLTAKGLLSRIKKGHSFVYEPAVSRVDFLKFAVNFVVDSARKDFSQYLSSGAKPSGKHRKQR